MLRAGCDRNIALAIVRVWECGVSESVSPKSADLQEGVFSCAKKSGVRVRRHVFLTHEI